MKNWQLPLFHSWPQKLISLFLLLILGWIGWHLLDFFVLKAVWQPDAEACQAARGIGACWGVVAEKYRLILLGRYPHEQHWRAIAACFILLGLLIFSTLPASWKPALPAIWLLGWLIFFLLMGAPLWGIGHYFNLTVITSDQWGGLPLTLMLTMLSITLALPMGILLALGRRSQWPLLSSCCTSYIELIRGVPLISVLFMASFMFPLLLPAGYSPDVLVRVWLGLSLFTAAYIAEIVRAGIQAIPKEQSQAALALGMSNWQIQQKIILPQALLHVVPNLVNSVISLFKDTSLVTIVSLYELSGSMELSLSGDANWRPFKLEAGLFIAIIYFSFCFALSRYGIWIENRNRHS